MKSWLGYSFVMNLVEHRKAHREYEMVKELEAGIELFGFEVKSLRAKHGKLEGAHVIVRAGEAYVVGMSIPPYQPANAPKDYDEARTRKLLLNKKELAEVAAAEGQKGLTIVPLAVYNKSSKLKLKIAIARGLKKYDKRALLKERDTKREVERTLKNQ
jgi:SsrA-binding protein